MDSVQQDYEQLSFLDMYGEVLERRNNMKDYQTGAVRDTGGKGRMDLLPMCALLRISHHMEDAILPDPETGIAHYPERNWEKGLPLHTMIDSALRHLAKYMDGRIDEDHLCAAATNLLMAMWIEEKLPDMIDIPAVKSSINVKLGKPIQSEKPTQQIENNEYPDGCIVVKVPHAKQG